MEAKEYFDAGQLGAAIEAAASVVRRQPANVDYRYLLCELLCFQGQWERADKQLELLSQQDAGHAIRATVFRQLIRAEVARQGVFASGHVPEFFADPPPALVSHLKALVARREEDRQTATDRLAEAEDERPRTSGICDDVPFDEIRDADDWTASFFEIVTASGQYYWLPFDMAASANLSAPRRPRDLLWRPVHVEMRDHPSIDGYLPTLYAGTCQSDDDELRLGRATHWSDADSGPVQGTGLRVYLLGEQDKTVLEFNEIRFGVHG